MSQVLSARNICCRYQKAEVLHDVSITVRPGKVSVLVGPSGCGKSTLLWALAGLTACSAGGIYLEDGGGNLGAGGEAGGAGQRQKARFPLAGLGMVFQQLALWEHVSVEGHLDLVLRGAKLPAAQRRERMDAILGRMRLSALRRRRPPQMSGGERQRLAIARALAIEPRWLLLDEPLAHLDGGHRAEMFELLREVLAQTSAGVLLSTHDPQEALKLADEIVIMADGRVLQSGPAREVYTHPASLTAARALGPAWEVSGQVSGGKLVIGGADAPDGPAVLEGLDSHPSGPLSLILRPEDVQFIPRPDGAVVVTRCDWQGGDYLLHLNVHGVEALVVSPLPIRTQSRGTLRLTRSVGMPHR